MDEETTRLSYLRSLELWFKASEKYLYEPPGRTDWLVYGTGFDSWGVQTQQKALGSGGQLSRKLGEMCFCIWGRLESFCSSGWQLRRPQSLGWPSREPSAAI